MSQDFPLESGEVDDLGTFFAESADTAAIGPPVPPGDTVDPAPAAADGRALVDILASLDDGALDSVGLTAGLAGRAGSDAAVGMDAAGRFALGDRVVSFSSGGTVYGVRVPEIVEVGRIPAITPVPQLPPWVRGVTNLRGDVVSVIDLAALCGMDPMSLNTGRMLVARQEDEDFTVGILVERVHEIAAVTAEQIKQPTAPLEGPLAPYLRGVCQRDTQVMVMLDLAALLRSPEVRQFEDLHLDA